MGCPQLSPLVPQSRYGDRYEMPLRERMRVEGCKLGKETFEPSEVEKVYEVDRDYNYI